MNLTSKCDGELQINTLKIESNNLKETEMQQV